MRQFEGFTNKIAVPSFTRDGAWHTVTLTGLPEDTELVTVQVHNPVGSQAQQGIRPTYLPS